MTDANHKLKLLKANIEGRLSVLEESKMRYVDNNMLFEASNTRQTILALQSVLREIEELLTADSTE